MNFQKISQTILIIVLFIFAKNSFAQQIAFFGRNTQDIEQETELAEEDLETEQENVRIELKDADPANFTKKIILQGLNKVTAKTFELKGEIGDTIKFERLIIKPLKCWKSPPTEKPENKALLKIYEQKLDGKKILIFYGWMFSSSPGLSGLEHPTYDITLKECEKEIENN